ncbi:hypothetical protein FNF29_04529 [Cafeteria roenbergensis]|uniref:Uncharacterized protein n=1 Tax=Cafeteria roenbergensis TaxID=33653 RepID=A0A5A8CF49_CAFRO|nr:hypothetical protein FNF29_04529 [Cafeteria roenbergensis]KAA0161024.1 hypothetical protein FNF28_05230 [Cafeteria roenbergensis]|eukprot:KAA0151605.1 hypothetical protein FNF29_04529 [Cafeteria roenbergensis]
MAPANSSPRAACSEQPPRKATAHSALHRTSKTMSGAPSRFSSFWRRSGLNYLEMITVASTSMRQCLKEPLRTEALGRTSYAFREFKFENGVEQPPETVSNMPDAERD